MSCPRTNEQFLQIVANILQMNIQNSKCLGLFEGDMVNAMFFYQYARYSNEDYYFDVADSIIDKIFLYINTTATKLNFSEGIIGIVWGFDYLIRNNFFDGNMLELLADVDKLVLNKKGNEEVFREEEFFSLGMYLVMRGGESWTYSQRELTILNYVLSEISTYYHKGESISFPPSNLNSVLFTLLFIEDHSKDMDVFVYINLILSKITETLSLGEYTPVDLAILRSLVINLALKNNNNDSTKEYLSEIEFFLTKEGNIITHYDYIKQPYLFSFYPTAFKDYSVDFNEVINSSLPALICMKHLPYIGINLMNSETDNI